ncbi:MAG: LacI family DNA-binding transcriptional regulator [Cytophagales bacterium]|nr:LacI family DNA-binding transcriptional regulator [Armatimonadota bacterium]
MANIRDVARAAGVSPATVSRTFTTPDLINAQTQKRVIEIARQMNYRPPRLRTSKGSLVSKTVSATVSARDAIGFQFFSAVPGDTLGSNTFYGPVFAGAMEEASTLGLHLLVHTTSRHALSLEVPRMVQEQAIGGMLLVGTADPEILSTFAAHVPNIVLVDNRDEAGIYESVISDGFGGVYAATHYLLGLGHRRIGFFLSEPGITTFQDRLRGYLCALYEAGVSVEPDLVLRGDGPDERRADQLSAYLTGPHRPTALITANDDTALVALQVCRTLNLTVPNDLSLVGFDDIEFSSHANPSLTTVRVAKEQMGRLAVRRLHARLGKESASSLLEQPVRHEIPVTLVIRESCQAL